MILCPVIDCLIPHKKSFLHLSLYDKNLIFLDNFGIFEEGFRVQPWGRKFLHRKLVLYKYGHLKFEWSNFGSDQLEVELRNVDTDVFFEKLTVDLSNDLG